jgi:plastocyanin
MNNTTEYSNNTYGKRSIWQWIFAYIVIGAIIYGLVYYFVLAKNNKSYGQSSQAQQSAAVSATNSPNSKQTENTVSLTENGYSPMTLKIKAGSKVTWTNNSGVMATVSSDPHPTHTDYPPLNLGKFEDGATLSLIFDKPGTYGYHNHLNSSQTGTIIVE